MGSRQQAETGSPLRFIAYCKSVCARRIILASN